MSDDLVIFREEINKIDNKILDLIVKRMEVSIKVGKYKKKHNINVINTNRENEVINRIINQNYSKIILDMNNNEKVLDEYFIKNLWNYLMDYSKKLQN